MTFKTDSLTRPGDDDDVHVSVAFYQYYDTDCDAENIAFSPKLLQPLSPLFYHVVLSAPVQRLCPVWRLPCLGPATCE